MGKQDMPNEYAKEVAEAYDGMTEEKAREEWDSDIYDILTKLRPKLLNTTDTIFPLKCPKCDSYRITVVFGTSRRLECLSCGSQYRIGDINEK